MISKLATNDNAKAKRCLAEGLGLVQQLGWSHTHILSLSFFESLSHGLVL